MASSQFEPTQQSTNAVEDYSAWSPVNLVQYGIFPNLIALIEPDPASNQSSLDVNQLDDEGISLLHWAAINNRLQIARYLLSKGAMVDRLGGNLEASPLHWAIRQSHLSMVHLLMRHEADASMQDKTGLACIHVAIQLGSVPIVAYLLAKGVDVDSRDRNGLTPLMIACMYSMSADIFRLLLAWGADLSVPDTHGSTAAHYAVNFTNAQAVMVLGKTKVDWNATNLEGQTPYEVRDVPWLSDRVRQMAEAQTNCNSIPCSSSSSSNRWSLTNLRNSVEWRNPILIAIPPTIMLACLLVLCFDSVWFLRLFPSLQPTEPIWWLVYLCKFLLLCLISYTSRRVISSFTDYRSQVFLIFNLALSTQLLLTFTYLGHVAHQNPNRRLLHFAFLVSITGVWLSFYLCCTKDPGYIAAASREDQRSTIVRLVEDTMSQLDKAADGSIPPNPLERFCTTCLIRKPLRSKHCVSCDRCVAKFDHHCPWIYNCVGMDNHMYFMCYLAFVPIACFLFVVGGGSRISAWSAEPRCKIRFESDAVLLNWLGRMLSGMSCSPWLSFCVANAGMYCFWTGLLFGFQFYQMVWLNATTNERMNIDRYVEFSGGLNFYRSKNDHHHHQNNKCGCGPNKKRSSKSPYNFGVLRNLLDLCGRPGYQKLSNRRTDWRKMYSIDQLVASGCHTGENVV